MQQQSEQNQQTAPSEKQ